MRAAGPDASWFPGDVTVNCTVGRRGRRARPTPATAVVHAVDVPARPERSPGRWSTPSRTVVRQVRELRAPSGPFIVPDRRAGAGRSPARSCPGRARPPVAAERRGGTDRCRCGSTRPTAPAARDVKSITYSSTGALGDLGHGAAARRRGAGESRRRRSDRRSRTPRPTSPGTCRRPERRRSTSIGLAPVPTCTMPDNTVAWYTIRRHRESARLRTRASGSPIPPTRRSRCRRRCPQARSRRPR